MITVKKVIEDLERLKDRYEELRLLIADQVRDNEIEVAKMNLVTLQDVRDAIEQMENLEVNANKES